MGSFLSGRPATKVTVESSLALNINELIRKRALGEGFKCTGSVQWPNRKASISYEADMRYPHDAFVRLNYTVNGAVMDYRVWLKRTPCRFGGFRWWWICPRTGHAAATLYLPSVAKTFGCRRAFRMAYRSERRGPMDRSHDRQARIFKKLGGDYRHFEQAPPKRPKGMHRRTYERLLAQLTAAEERHESIFIIGALRFLKKDPSFRQRFPSA